LDHLLPFFSFLFEEKVSLLLVFQVFEFSSMLSVPLTSPTPPVPKKLGFLGLTLFP